MPTNRFNYSDDFVLNNGKVGINSASPQEKLDVVGITKAENLSVVGVSSLTGYEGFLRANHNIVESTSLEGGQGTTGSLSGEIVIGTGVTVTGVTTATSGQGYIDSLKVYNTFTVPVGGTEERPTKAKPGQLYYNEDFKTIEFYDGNVWRQVDNTTRSGRGVFGGGQSPTFISNIDYVNINTQGNAISFGDMVASSGNSVRSGVAPVSSSTRGIFLGGGSPTRRNDCDYITIASEGNGIDFGNLTETSGFNTGASSSTRGLRMGGSIPGSNVNTIDYVEIATIGNALDFGDLTELAASGGAVSSPVRAVRAGGDAPSGTSAVIDFVIISSKGNATDFGDLSESRTGSRGNVNSSVRGIFGGGRNPLVLSVSTIDYITITSTGNAVFFGDLTKDRQGAAGASTQIRGVFAGGAEYTPSAVVENIIDYITIASTGNAQDFGDMTVGRQFAGGLSDSHGGLGGF
jgi:hypothetical protein